MNSKVQVSISSIGAYAAGRRRNLCSSLRRRLASLREYRDRIRSNRWRLIRIGYRFFTVQEPRSIRSRERRYYSDLKPFPRHRGIQPTLFPGGRPSVLPADTYMRFLLIGTKGKFKQIEVVQEHGRRGWATDMVKALLKAHPDAVWQNENLNENSGPLFQHLSAQFPTRIAKVSIGPDGTFSIAPPLQRSSTTPGTRFSGK